MSFKRLCFLFDEIAEHRADATTDVSSEMRFDGFEFLVDAQDVALDQRRNHLLDFFDGNGA